MEKSGRRSEPKVWGMLAVGALLVILGLTLYPNPNGAVGASRTPLLCVVCGEQGGADVLLNLLLFIPFGVGLRLSGVSWGKAVLICAAVSFTVESMQFAVITGRDASLSDLLTNTLGGAFGAAIARRVRVALNPDGVSATRLTAGMAALWLAMLATSAWLMAPWTPEHTTAWSHWAPEPSWPPSFDGRVTAVQSLGFALPPGPLPDSVATRVLPELKRGRIEMRIDLISAKAPPRRGWIYFLQVGNQFAPRVSQEGRDLLVELPVRATHFRLAAPTLLLKKGMPRASGTPVTIEISDLNGYLSLVSSYGGRTFPLSIGPTQGWSLVDPFGFHLGPEVRWLTGLWVACWLVPLGYWGGRSNRPLAALALAVGAVALGLWVLPALAGFAPVHRSEWLAAAIGLAIGRALGACGTYLASRCGSPSASESSSS